MEATVVFFLIVHLCAAYNNVSVADALDEREEIFDFIADVLELNLKAVEWENFLCFGNFPDNFYKKIRGIPFTTVVTNVENDDHEIVDVVPYYSNVIVIEFQNFSDFEETLQKAKYSSYWHPHANIIMYCHGIDRLSMAKIFYILWYYRGCNVVIIQFDDRTHKFLVSYFSPFITENYQLDDSFGCWTARKLDMPINYDYQKSFVCVEKCDNVTSESNLRENNLGTCIGMRTHRVASRDLAHLKMLNLFEDKGKNLRGFPLRAYATEVLPFFSIEKNVDGTFILGARDGIIWNELSKVMNFSIDLSPSVNVMKSPFNFELNMLQVFSLALRKADLFLIPIYQFHLMVVDVDYTFPLKESGVCFVSHRSAFENILFDTRILYSKYKLVIEFLVCLLCVWFVFFVFNVAHTGRISLDQIGKDLLNTVRNVLLITLHRPPKQRSFRIFMAVSLWSFFVLNFSSQATITSFFTAIKRGKEVETFEDILQKGYPIEGMASPDILLANTDETYEKIYDKLVPIQDIFECIKKMANDSRRFCLMDCAVGRYLERNLLDDKGEQYLHIATDRMHSHYLNLIYPQHSVLSSHTSSYMMKFVEAGLIKKWEQYRFKNMKSEAPVKPLGIDDIIGIFNMYCLSVLIIIGVFFLEIILGNLKKIKKCCFIRF